MHIFDAFMRGFAGLVLIVIAVAFVFMALEAIAMLGVVLVSALWRLIDRAHSKRLCVTKRSS